MRPHKVICISVYNEDLKSMDQMVRRLKERGYTRANRSMVLRAAFRSSDMEVLLESMQEEKRD